MEFVQFHPTALALETGNGASLPLLTEALRGAGALLLDEQGERFMLSEHPEAELAPRDVVARSIEKKTRAGQTVYLDLRPVLSSARGSAFPKAIQTATNAGFDACVEALPITPAAHYHMGGIEVDSVGRTSIDGLWACGEVATTGIHGANRLASNSLLEALVWARRVAGRLVAEGVSREETCNCKPAVPRVANVAASLVQEHVDAARKIMSAYVGIVRSGDGLEAAYDQISAVDRRLDDLIDEVDAASPARPGGVRQWAEARNLILVARLVTFSALRREESRGAHYRDDYPLPRQEWQRHQSLTVDTLVEAH